MLASYAPDFVVTVSGKDVTEFVKTWKLTDSEQNTSSITVTVDNKDNRFDGAFKIGSEVSLRFGSGGQMSDQVTMLLLKYKEQYGAGCLITITGLDYSTKMSKKQGQGHYVGKGPSAVKSDIEKKTGVTIEFSQNDVGEAGDGKAATAKPEECSREWLQSGTDYRQKLEECLKKWVSKKQGTGGDQPHQQADTKGESGKGATAEDGQVTSGLSGNTTADKNKATNASNRAKSDTITADMKLRGYPLLKAKQNVDIQGVGSLASGGWYVQTVEQYWDKSSGYLTHAKLIRGGTGKDGGKSTPPAAVVYADIYKKNTIYAGLRKVDGGSQATFTFGDGTYLKSFDFQINIPDTRNSGNYVGGKTVNPSNAEEPVKEQKPEGSSGGGGGSVSTPPLNTPQ